MSQYFIHKNKSNENVSTAESESENLDISFL